MPLKKNTDKKSDRIPLHEESLKHFTIMQIIAMSIIAIAGFVALVAGFVSFRTVQVTRCELHEQGVKIQMNGDVKDFEKRCASLYQSN